MGDVQVRLGNTAPRTSARRLATEEEAKAPEKLALASKEKLADGSEQYYVLEKRPVPGLEHSITTFVVPDNYSRIDAIRDIALAFHAQHSDDPAEWVHCEDEQYAKLIADHLSHVGGEPVPVLSSADIEELLGAADAEEAAKAAAEPADDAPEDAPAAGPPLAGAAIQAIGRDLWAQALGDMTADTGTSTSAPTSTTLTDTGKAWTTNQWAGKDVSCGGVVGTVLTNTATVLTIARWETPGSRSGATATTPASGTYHIHSGQVPAVWVALTANNTTPTVGGADTTLTGEIVTASSGFLRKVLVYAHTTGTNTYTLTGTYTATGSDTFPQTIAKFGVLDAQNGGRLLFETLFSAVFTANQTGDNVQLTETVTGT